jgi:NitT/TauT family transport system permease protein
MADSAREKLPYAATARRSGTASLVGQARRWLPVALAVAVVLVVGSLLLTYHSAAPDAPLVQNSTPGQLVTWMADQSKEAAPEALLGGVAKSWASSLGTAALDPQVALSAVRAFILLLLALVVGLLIISAVALAAGAGWSRSSLLAALIGLDVLLFIIPFLDNDSTVATLLLGIFLLLALLLLAPGRVTKFLGFMVVLSALLMTWEVAKNVGAAVSYRITLPRGGWNDATYPKLDDALAALQKGEVRALVVDSKQVAKIVPENGGSADGMQYADLRILKGLSNSSLLGLPVVPDFPSRLVVVARADDASAFKSLDDVAGAQVGAVAGEFAETKYLSLPRGLLLVNLDITNDLKMPHLQSIAESLLQPARRNGPVLLIRILGEAALFTWTEAAIGFISGALLGFLLGTLFAHSRLMERGLLPYVVASQTVPILAIAPMVVYWLGASSASVAVISAYLTFFPVTINTLRGLTSPSPSALELMHSYAANWWTILWKLRFPAALPYIFTALKVSATASVVGAIIGELPSGIPTGLGRAILNFNQYYTSDPSKLWAAIFIAALVGIGFFLLVAGIERLALRGGQPVEG